MSITGLALSAYPVFGMDTIETAQARVQKSVPAKDIDPDRYGMDLYLLAQAYYTEGKNVEAENTFRQCLPYYFASSPTYKQSARADLIMSWANFQLTGNGTDFDYNRIDKLTLEALDEIDKIPDKLQRAQIYQSAIIIFKRTGNLYQAERCKNFLLNSCSECETNKDAELGQIKRAAMTLQWIAEKTFPLKFRPFEPKLINAADLEKRGLSEDQFLQAEKLILRATKLCERKKELAKENAILHDRLGQWYENLGKIEQAKLQFEIAKRILPVDKNSRKSCGRVIGQITEKGTISGACGMG